MNGLVLVSMAAQSHAHKKDASIGTSRNFYLAVEIIKGKKSFFFSFFGQLD